MIFSFLKNMLISKFRHFYWPLFTVLYELLQVRQFRWQELKQSNMSYDILYNIGCKKSIASFFYKKEWVELVWRSNSVMYCHATAWGSIPGWNSVFTELHVLYKGQ